MKLAALSLACVWGLSLTVHATEAPKKRSRLAKAEFTLLDCNAEKWSAITFKKILLRGVDENGRKALYKLHVIDIDGYDRDRAGLGGIYKTGTAVAFTDETAENANTALRIERADDGTILSFKVSGAYVGSQPVNGSTVILKGVKGKDGERDGYWLSLEGNGAALDAMKELWKPLLELSHAEARPTEGAIFCTPPTDREKDFIKDTD